VTESPSLGDFFAQVRAGQLIAIKCDNCGALAIPPRQLCPACGQRKWSQVRLSGEGVIASFTVIRIAPRAHAGESPYAIAAVKLPEGVSILGRVVDIPFERLAVGLKVRFRPLVVKDQTAIGFGPV
jgi:uncharacterized OB-fold protein